MKKRAKSENKPDTRRVEVKTDTLRYASAGAARQDVSLKRATGAARQDASLKRATEAKAHRPQPKKPSTSTSVYKTMGPRDQPGYYENMRMGDQSAIYEDDTF